MDLSTLYKDFKPFEPYFKLIMSFYYNEDGNPRVVDFPLPHMTPEEQKIFKENIISLHKKYIEFDVLSREIFRLQSENIKLYFKLY
jgi:hypothetical protein